SPVRPSGAATRVSSSTRTATRGRSPTTRTGRSPRTVRSGSSWSARDPPAERFGQIRRPRPVEARDHVAVRIDELDLGVRPLDGLIGEEEHPPALGVVLELDSVREVQADAGDVGAFGVHAPAAAEAVAAPAPAQVDTRRARWELTAPGGAGDPPRDPRLADPVGSDEHGHLQEAAIGVLGFERDDEQAPPQ